MPLGTNSYLDGNGKTAYAKNTTGSTVVKNKMFLMNGHVFVTTAEVLNNANAWVYIAGTFRAPKVTADVVAFGDDLYFDSGAGLLTTTVGANTYAGMSAGQDATGASNVIYLELGYPKK